MVKYQLLHVSASEGHLQGVYWKQEHKSNTLNQILIALTYLPTHSLTPWSSVLLENLTGSQLVYEFPAFPETECSLPQSQVLATCPYPELCVNILKQDTFLRWGFASSSPNPQAGGPPLVSCLRLLIKYIRSYPPNWRPFLHPQPENAPFHGDRDPLSRDRPIVKY
jgi:hypothetical protein